MNFEPKGRSYFAHITSIRDFTDQIMSLQLIAPHASLRKALRVKILALLARKLGSALFGNMGFNLSGWSTSIPFHFSSLNGHGGLLTDELRQGEGWWPRACCVPADLEIFYHTCLSLEKRQLTQ